MGIFDGELPEEQKKQSELNRRASQVSGIPKAFEALIVEAFNDFWNNSIVTPQEICDYHGKDAYLLFTVLSDAVDFIVAKLDAEFKLPPIPYEYTINQDGSVTIGAKKEQPQEPLT